MFTLNDYLQAKQEFLKTHILPDISLYKRFSATHQAKELFKEWHKEYPVLFNTIHDLQLFIENKDNEEYPKTLFCKFCGNRLRYTKEKGYRTYCSHECSLKDSSNEVQLARGRELSKQWAKEHPEEYKKIIDAWKVKGWNWCKEHKGKWQQNMEIGHELFASWKNNNTTEYQQFLKNSREGSAQWRKEHPEQAKVIMENAIKKAISFVQKDITHKENLTEKYTRENFIKDGFFLVPEFQSYFNVSSTTAYAYKDKWNIKEPNSTYKSKQQLLIAKFLEELGLDYIVDSRKIIPPAEVDLYVPSKKLAIEFNGLMFHSFGYSLYTMFDDAHEEKLHYKDNLWKYEALKAKGIQLFTIWENIWLTNPELIKSMIFNLCGECKNKIFARKCILREVSSKVAKDFYQLNHLQGGSINSVSIGLFYQNEPVSIMSFNKSTNSQCEWELSRFCSKQFTIVVGGASRLLKYFESKYHPTSMVSYANKLFSNGNLYEKLGFIHSHDSAPRYHYFHYKDLTKVYNRQTFMKYKLKNKLENFDEQLTERENMYNHGYRRIYDCGTMVYVKRY